MIYKTYANGLSREKKDVATATVKQKKSGLHCVTCLMQHVGL